MDSQPRVLARGVSTQADNASMARFEDQDLTDAEFRECDLTRARYQGCRPGALAAGMGSHRRICSAPHA